MTETDKFCLHISELVSRSHIRRMDLENVTSREKSSTRNQYVASIVCTLVCVCCGAYVGWPSYTVPYLLSSNQTVFQKPITSLEASMIGSIPNFSAIIGTPLFGWLFERFGRKTGGVTLTVPLVISWSIILLAPSSKYLIVARILAGLSGGGAAALPPLYTGEIAEISIRGTVGSFMTMGFATGVMVSYVLGSLVEYYTICTILLSLSVLYGILMCFMPETPAFLMKKGREEEAAKSLAWLRGTHINSQIVRDEIAYLRQKVNNVTEHSNISPMDEKLSIIKDTHDEKTSLKKETVLPVIAEFVPVKISRPAWKQLFLDRPSRNAFALISMLMFFQCFSGFFAIQAFAADIFAAANTGFSPNLCSIIYSICLIIGCGLTAVLADITGRKILMVSSCLGLAVLLTLMGFVLQTGYLPSIVTAICLCLCAIIFSMGASSVPYVIMGECFSSDVRDLATCLLVQYNYFAVFLVVHFLRTGMEMFGAHGVFYIFAGVCSVGTVCCYILQPETKGLTMEQMLELFGGDREQVATNDQHDEAETVDKK